MAASTRLDIDKTLAKLTLGQKVKLLSGSGWWHTTPVPEADIPAIRMSNVFNGVPSSCFPSSTGLGSSFDTELAAEVGCHILLGPTVNTQRSPLGGRGFESFSEDPHLNGTIAAAYINGLQSKGVAATIKHFVAYDQEFRRCSISSDPFQIAVKEANPWALMTAYSRLNGLHCSENEWLLDDLLRKEWGYKGMIMSDWSGTYSTAESIQAGVDVEMPGPTVMRGDAAIRAVVAEKLFLHDIDCRVRKVLEMLQHAYESGIPFDTPEEPLDTPQVRALLRRAAADAIVLLKNEKSLLPIGAGVHKIAVIGPNAKQAVISGGGSASLPPTYSVSPLEGVTESAKEIGAEVEYTAGTLSYRYLPAIDPYITYDGKRGAFFEAVPAVWSTRTNSAKCFLADGIDDTKVNEICWLRFTATFVPDEDGDWEIGMNIAGRGNLFIDDKLVIELSINPKQGDSFFGLGTVDIRTVVKGLKAGTKHRVEVRLSNKAFIAGGAPFAARGGIQLDAIRRIDPEDGIKRALRDSSEREGYDRQNMDLPGLTNRLVAEVLAANPKTVVVNQSGTPVEMPWIGDAHTLLQAFYGGNEAGNGIADAVFGKVNPSGKLALTFPKHIEDNPSYPSFGDKPQVHGKIVYNEGIFVGYRGYEVKKLAPLFPFGHGLSYTTFDYSALEVSGISEHGKFSVSFTVKNMGNVEGREVTQVYIADPQSSLPRPVKELKGFAKVPVKSGHSEKVTVHLDKYAISFYDERKGAWVAEAGKFKVLVGASSADVRLSGEVELGKSFYWTGL
ncbi:glycoside hydrolase family 3 protein [Phanerochaete carnosa HHB-10118-sp]|uniref:beta-glucosidase n=1 Tax=Phanerochaete carnosa (strain HHB-10118-sp) TaxID=650164 RepID=K5X8Q8_PHACS|nr:glycoside hydrolase family 3 protein [Phanerochaete carnosa HHB-10118-sp]EKM59267.1 glycoside hydrolase family 3 protein [Phanerochaete carnosa HHB-10118-sp]